ncbi:MAG TPA: DUF4390 domain-containing protein [Thermoanaerobaculia bacterium]|nr:DUF4390 domain-containing protein [Thermoanaerobaculia bacterium]
MRVRILSAVLLCAALRLAAAPPQPRIEHLAASAVNGKVSVHFALAGIFQNGEMIQALQSGLPTSFTYIVEIFRDRPNWFDEDVGRSRLEVICTFNSVTREYLLNYRRDRKLVRSETFGDLAALQQRMTTIEEADLFDIGHRKPYKMKVRVKADLMRGWLAYVIPWEVSTRWREARVNVTAPKGPTPAEPVRR